MSCNYRNNPGISGKDIFFLGALGIGAYALYQIFRGEWRIPIVSQLGDVAAAIGKAGETIGAAAQATYFEWEKGSGVRGMIQQPGEPEIYAMPKDEELLFPGVEVMEAPESPYQKDPLYQIMKKGQTPSKAEQEARKKEEFRKTIATALAKRGTRAPIEMAKKIMGV